MTFLVFYYKPVSLVLDTVKEVEHVKLYSSSVVPPSVGELSLTSGRNSNRQFCGSLFKRLKATAKQKERRAQHGARALKPFHADDRPTPVAPGLPVMNGAVFQPGSCAGRGCEKSRALRNYFHSFPN